MLWRLEFLKKSCPNCNKQLPEEATFCLYCYTNLSDTESGAVAVPKKTFNKKILSRILIVVAFLVIIGVSVIALKHSVSQPALTPADTTVITEKQTVPVTDASGEAVTDENGEQVFDTITVTKTQVITTTEKQGLLDKIFNNETENKASTQANENSSDSNPEKTTEKQSWLDKLFGNDETQPHTTEPTTQESDENKPQTSTTEVVSTSDDTNEKNTDSFSQKGTSSSTEKETTKPTGTTTTETVSTTAPKQEDDFTFTVVNGSVKLLSYTGNSSVVRVPAEIDGKHVAYLGSNVFSNKSNITSIIFEGASSGSEKFYLPANTTVFNSLPNLTTVEFPFETNNYFINSDGSTSYTYSFGTIFSNCPKVSAINFGAHINSMHSPSMSRMYSIDGVVFVNTSSEISLLWYPVAKTQSDYTVPDNVRKIEKNAFSNNAYLQSVTLSSKVRSVVGPNFRNCTKLSSFFVAEGNTKFFAENGVLYFPGFTINNLPSYGAFYPPAKADTAFSFPQDKTLYLDAYTFCGNPNLKEITIFGISRIDGAMLSSDLRPINLEKIVASKNCLIPSNAENLYTVEYFD